MPDSRATTRRAAVVAVAALLIGLTAGCASRLAAGGARGAKRPPSPPFPAAAAAQRPVSGYDTTGAALARQIAGCHPAPLTPRTAAQRLHLPAARALVSAASCTLRGRTALVLTFTSHTSQAALDAELRGRVAYYATGPGWSAAPTDTSERVGQQSVVQDAALALGGLVKTGGE